MLVAHPGGDPSWRGPYLKKGVPVDPWGRPYVYEQPGTHSGDFDLQCEQDGTCLGPRFIPRGLYFSSIDSVEFRVFSAKYEAGACGVWHQSLSGDSGDIVC